MSKVFEVDAPDDKYGSSRYNTVITLPDISNIDWGIGVIYGPSGTGKSTILSTLFDTVSKTNNIEGRPIDHINEDILIAVGLMSIPSWYTNVNNLSGVKEKD